MTIGPSTYVTSRKTSGDGAKWWPTMVLHVMNSAAGGAALSTLGLIEEFKKHGISNCAVCHDAGSKLERQQLLDATDGRAVFQPLYWWNKKIRAKWWKRPLIELRQIIKTGWTRRSTAAIVSFALRHHADLIHTNTILNPEGGLAARRLGLPHVWHVRELLGRSHPFQLSISDAALARFIERHASVVIANSRITATTAGPVIPADALRIVPNGIDLRAFVPRNNSHQSSRPIVVGMVASLSSQWKKHELFIEAAERLMDLPDLEFRIYGHDSTAGGAQPGDEYAERIHRIVRDRGLIGRFRWPGHVADPAQIMAEIDMLVHSADGESFGRAPVEAMAAGLPVVGVRGGGVGEVVEHGVTGLLANPDDATDFAQHIRTLVTNESLRQQYGAAGRSRAEKMYSLESCAAGVLRVYEEAMRRPVGGRGRAAESNVSIAKNEAP